MSIPPAEPLPRLTPRLRLRRLRAADLPDFLAYRRDPAVARYQGWSIPTDADGAAFLAEMAEAPLFRPGQWTQLAIADRLTDQLLGDIGIWLAADQAVAEIGFTLRTSAQGRGLAAEAVPEALALLWRTTPVALLRGITDARNAPSIRLLERLGLTRREVREAVFRGEACTELVYERPRPPAG